MKPGRPKLPARKRGGKLCIYATAETRDTLHKKRRAAGLGISQAVAAAVKDWTPTP